MSKTSHEGNTSDILTWYMHRLREFEREIVWVRIIKIVVVLAPVLIGFMILNHRYVLTPSLTYTYKPGGRVGVIGPEQPESLLQTADTQLKWKLSTETLPMHVRIPRILETVDVRLRLDPGTQPYASFTAKGKNGIDQTSILYAEGLENLDWKAIQENGLTLWQRNAQGAYASIQKFLADPPDPTQIAVAGIDRMAFSKPVFGQTGANTTTVAHDIRGSHALYTFVENGSLSVHMQKIDLNRVPGQDTLVIRVYRVSTDLQENPVPVAISKVQDDGDAKDSDHHGDPQPVDFVVDNLQTGIYRIELDTSEDVLIRDLAVNQAYLAFDRRVFLAEGPTYGTDFDPVSLATNGSQVSVAAVHDVGKQKISIGSHTLVLKDLKVDETATELVGTTHFRLNRGDVIVQSDGLIEIDDAKLLSAGAKSLDVTGPKLRLKNIDYVLARYVTHANGSIEFDQKYDVNELELFTNDLKFVLYTPNLVSGNFTLGFKDFKVRLQRGPFPWSKIPEKIGKVLGRK